MSYKPHNPLFARYLSILKELAHAERGLVAQRRHLTINGLDSCIHRIRNTVTDARWFINNVNILEAKYPHMKRMLLPVSAPDLEKIIEEDLDEDVEVILSKHISGKKQERKETEENKPHG